MEYRLEGSPEGTSGGISYAFPLCFIVLFLYISFVFYGFISYIFFLYFMVLLKQLRRLYISGFYFQVPPVHNYSTCYTEEFPIYFCILWFYSLRISFIFYGPPEDRMVYLRPIGRPYGSLTAHWKAVRFILRTVSRTYG